MPTDGQGHMNVLLTCRGSGSALPCSCACTSGLHACISLSKSGGAGARVAADAASCTERRALQLGLEGLDSEGAVRMNATRCT